MKIADIDRKILYNSIISMKCSGKMQLMIILKVTKNKGFTLSLENKFFGKPQRSVKLTPQTF